VLKRAVVALPRIHATPAWQRVLDVRARFDPLAERIAPHVTLVFPFEDPINDADLEDHVRGVAGRLDRFPITLAEVTAHESEYLFLNIKRGNDAVVQLHDALYTGVLALHRSRMHTFVPHVTVGRVSREQLPAALEATTPLSDAIDARIDSLVVYSIEPQGIRPIRFDVALR
jgi:2'-5' RNA ligase